MDTQTLLEKLLASGKKLAEQGKDAAKQGVDFAAEKLGVPTAQGEKRDAVVSGLTKGAIAGGLVALLLGTKSGRRIAGPALKLGTLAAVGGLAYKVYADWKTNQGESIEGNPVGSLTGPDANDRSIALVRSMIGAAKSDGHIDAVEQARILEQIKGLDLGDTATELLMTEVQKPLNVTEIAAGARSPEAAVEVYLASLLLTDQENQDERNYLNQLATELDLDPVLVRSLETEAFAPA